MAICPFMSQQSNNVSRVTCNSSCALFVKGHCSLALIGKKILNDAQVQKLKSENMQNKD